MATCKKCGGTVEDGAKFCPSCGAQMDTSAGASEQTEQNNGNTSSAGNDFSAKISALNDTPDTTADFAAEDIRDNTAMAVLSYLSWLVLIPLLAAKNSKFARYHVNQGLVLAITELLGAVAFRIIQSILLLISWRLAIVANILGTVMGLAFLVLTILGIVNAAGGKAKELPVIGKIKILK